MTDFSDLLGKTIVGISGAEAGGEQIEIKTADGLTYRMSHSQDCCESVSINDICGDIQDVINAPILLAEDAVSEDDPEGAPVPEYRDDSQTWTFYKLSTIKGSVTIRWYGSSNGYYSESVDFCLV